ncbi:MAG: DUF4956 domain-containing protein [Clostridiaceae bacterium]|nr:DUF4956 domain-containing protein [Clostridiaceae bacterium]
MDKSLNFQDILKKGFSNLDTFQKIPTSEVMICLVFTLIAGLFIFFIYKYTFKGVVYSYAYNVSLLMMCMLTSLIVLTISSNVALSLGMVGALSIVRFRTALKDPMDIMFMFWAITVGIASGAKVYSVSIFGSLFVGLIILIMTNYKIKSRTYMLIIHFEEEAKDNVKIILEGMKYVTKGKTVAKGITELSVEVKVKSNNSSFVNEISQIPGVMDASLISYNGDYAE